MWDKAIASNTNIQGYVLASVLLNVCQEIFLFKVKKKSLLETQSVISVLIYYTHVMIYKSQGDRIPSKRNILLAVAYLCL